MNNLAHARVRLAHVLQRPSPEQLGLAERWLETWVREYGPEADFPWICVYSNEQGEVEFEFHLQDRHLVLRCLSTAKVDYSAWNGEDDDETEHEGVCLPERVVPMIEWVAGKRQDWPEML